MNVSVEPPSVADAVVFDSVTPPTQPVATRFSTVEMLRAASPLLANAR